MPHQRIGDADVLLSQTGLKQVSFQCTTQPEHFKGRPPQKILCSPLRRAIITALAAYPNESIVLDTRLREKDATSGLMKLELEAYIAKHHPRAVALIDVSRIPANKRWWGIETDAEVRQRLQSLLVEVKDFCLSSGTVAFVGHSLAMQYLVGYPIKPFPATWGAPRGWPKNFKPYFASLNCSPDSRIRVVPSEMDTAQLVLVRHAHSEAQAARTAEKKIQRAEGLDPGSPGARLKRKKKRRIADGRI